jgi:hypothetical protein
MRSTFGKLACLALASGTFLPESTAEAGFRGKGRGRCVTDSSYDYCCVPIAYPIWISNPCCEPVYSPPTALIPQPAPPPTYQPPANNPPPQFNSPPNNPPPNNPPPQVNPPPNNPPPQINPPPFNPPPNNPPQFNPPPNNRPPINPNDISITERTEIRNGRPVRIRTHMDRRTGRVIRTEVVQ